MRPADRAVVANPTKTDRVWAHPQRLRFGIHADSDGAAVPLRTAADIGTQIALLSGSTAIRPATGRLAGDGRRAGRPAIHTDCDPGAEPGDGLWLDRYGHSVNLVGVPSAVLASPSFNDEARELHIAGARETNAGLFRLLAAATTVDAATALFRDYMTVTFGLSADRCDDATDRFGRRRYRSSYLRLLKGWAYDSNGPEGAVLKGWVESRFGLFPTYHRQPIRKFSSPAWYRYVEEKMGSRFHNNAIFGQLDLLYEFCQWLIASHLGQPGHWRLFRGVEHFEEHHIVERLDRRRCVVRLNNLVSFTPERDIATCFGDRILEARVPTCKVVFCNALLADNRLNGEAEVLVIGGNYTVGVRYD